MSMDINTLRSYVQANTTVADDQTVGFKDTSKKTGLQGTGRTFGDAAKTADAQDTILLKSNILSAVRDSAGADSAAFKNLEEKFFGKLEGKQYSAENAAKPLTMRDLRAALESVDGPARQPAATGIDGFEDLGGFEEIGLPKEPAEPKTGVPAPGNGFMDDFEEIDIAAPADDSPKTYDEATLREGIHHDPHASAAHATFGRGILAIFRGIRNIFAKTQSVEDAQEQFVARRHANRRGSTVDLRRIKNTTPVTLDKQTVGKAAGLVGNVIVKPFASRDVFGDGPKLTDINQNPALQDCWFLASVASVLSAKGPDYIKSLIEIPANGNHANVKMGGKVFKVPLADYTDKKGHIVTSNSAPWVRLLEMAAQMYFIDDKGCDGRGETKMEFRAGSAGIFLLTQGVLPTAYMKGTDGIVGKVREAVEGGRAVTLGHTGIGHCISPGHMVSVAGFSPDGSRVHLLDPYGRMVVADASMLKDYAIYIEAQA